MAIHAVKVEDFHSKLYTSAACFASGSFSHIFTALSVIYRKSYLLHNLFSTCYKPLTRILYVSFYLKRIFYNFNYLNECFSSFKLLKSPCAYRRYSFTSNLYPIPQIVRISSPFSPILLRSFFTCVSMVLASPK